MFTAVPDLNATVFQKNSSNTVYNNAETNLTEETKIMRQTSSLLADSMGVFFIISTCTHMIKQVWGRLGLSHAIKVRWDLPNRLNLGR